MHQTVEVVSLLLVAAAWAFSLAHAAEYPGKMRLDRDSYLAVQRIYYPGFTIGGASEPLAIVALGTLLALTSTAVEAFWLTAIALAAVAATQAVFWIVTQPVNRTWVEDIELGAAGKRFFGGDTTIRESDWIDRRRRWETSHLARAALMSIGLIALAVAVTG